eukprot:UN09483
MVFILAMYAISVSEIAIKILLTPQSQLILSYRYRFFTCKYSKSSFFHL